MIEHNRAIQGGSSAQVLDGCEFGQVVGDGGHRVPKLISSHVEIAQEGKILVHVVVLYQLSHEATIGKGPADMRDS